MEKPVFIMIVGTEKKKFGENVSSPTFKEIIIKVHYIVSNLKLNVSH